MSPNPLLISGRKLVKLFEQIGYVKVSQRGSHIKMKNHASGTAAIIPDHKELDRWTPRTILKQAEISDEQYNEMLKKG